MGVESGIKSSRLHSEFEISQDYTRTCLKAKKRNPQEENNLSQLCSLRPYETSMAAIKWSPLKMVTFVARAVKQRNPVWGKKMMVTFSQQR